MELTLLLETFKAIVLTGKVFGKFINPKLEQSTFAQYCVYTNWSPFD